MNEHAATEAKPHEQTRSAPPEARPAVLVRLLPKLLVSLALGALFAWVSARGGVPLLPSGAALARVQPWAPPVSSRRCCSCTTSAPAAGAS